MLDKDQHRLDSLHKGVYEDYKDFQNIAKYPQLYNNETNPQYHIIFNKDQSIIAIYKIVEYNQLKLCIPQSFRHSINENIIELRNLVLESAHETLGHGSGEKTYQYLKNYYFGPSMRKDAIHYYNQCDTCQYTMFSIQASYGLAKPLPIPMRLFTHLSIDFLELPPKITEEGKIFNAMWTIVDQFSGYVRITPINKFYVALEIIEILTSTIYPEWGLPDDIVSDMDTQFTSKPFKTWCKYHNINQSIRTAYDIHQEEYYGAQTPLWGLSEAALKFHVSHPSILPLRLTSNIVPRRHPIMVVF